MNAPASLAFHALANLDLRPAQEFAAAAGCRTNDPALLAIYDSIRRKGIREARDAHDDRYAMLKRYKANPYLFFGLIRPSLSTDEAIEESTRIIFRFRNLPTWQQEGRRAELAKAKQVRVFARFFRLYGKRIWLREVAA